MTLAAANRAGSASETRTPSHIPIADLALSLCWIPFVAVGVLAHGDTDRIAFFVSLTLLISFSHQPLTLALVYGDRRNFQLRRQIFTWSPVVLAVAVLAAQHISLTALAIVAGLWNAEHSLMQRYGIMRMYGRRAGDHRSGAIDKALLWSWLGLALVWVAADSRTATHIEQTGIGGKNRRGLDVLADTRSIALVLLPVAAAVAVAATVRWVARDIRSKDNVSASKRLYVASTAALFVTILVNPIAGFLGFVGAHAIEYFLIVHKNVGGRYASAKADGGALLGHAVRRVGRLGCLSLYLGTLVGGLWSLGHIATPTTYNAVLLTLGGMHVLYDGFIWKSPARTPHAGMFARQKP